MKTDTDFSRQKKKYIIIFITAFILITAVTVTFVYFHSLNESKEKYNKSETAETGSSYSGIIINDDNGMVEIANKYAKQILKDPDNLSEIISESDSDSADTDRPLNKTITFTVNDSCSINDIEVQTADNADFNNSSKITLNPESRSFQLTNLKSDSQYYYSVTVNFEDGSSETASSSFKTEDSVRMIYIEGIHNARDIGYLKTSDGHKLNQDMIIRGSEYDGADNPTTGLSEEKKKEFLNLINFKSDIDLRGTYSSYTDTLGENVTHIQFDCPFYDKMFTNQGKSVSKDILSLLSKKSNYPVYIHCSLGFERAGVVCYLLESLLGVSQKDAYADFQLSALYYKSDRVSDNINNVFKILNEEYEGSSLKEKAENYFLSCGNTPEEIESFREIMTQDQ